MRFRREQLEWFSRFSGDRNPLHVDALYSARTPFGQPVVHGVAAVLQALAEWSGGRPFQLARIRCVFHRAIFLGVDYELASTEQDGTLRLTWRRDDENVCDVVATLAACRAEGGAAPGTFRPLASARDETVTIPHEVDDLDYDTQEAPPPPAGGLWSPGLPRGQLRLLAGLSYLVGMVTPGRQALFAEIDAEFDRRAPSPIGCAYLSGMRAAYDVRFRRLAITGTSGDGAVFKAIAFVRPRPVDPGIEEITARLAGSRSLANKTAVVTGASRGFGAAMAKAIGVAGGRVLVHYAMQRDAAERVADEIRRHSDATTVQADLRTSEGNSSLERALVAAFGRADIVVLNAVTPIDLLRTAWATRSATAFVAEHYTMTAGPLHALLPSVAPSGTFVAISSCYVRRSVPGLAHYVAAKSAVEGLVRSLAEEHTERRWVIARPPRMLTDQTNTLAIGQSQLASAAAVACALTPHLVGPPGLVEIDLPGPESETS